MQRHDADLEKALRQSRSIDQLATVDRDALMASMRRLDVRAGKTVFHQGDPGQTLLLVVDGVLAVYFDDSDVRTKLRNVSRGEFLGEMSILDPAPRSATVVAETDCVLWALESIDLAVLWESNPAASVALVDAVCFILSQRLRRMTRRLDRLMEPMQRSPSGRHVVAPKKRQSALISAWKRLLRPGKTSIRNTR